MLEETNQGDREKDLLGQENLTMGHACKIDAVY